MEFEIYVLRGCFYSKRALRILHRLMRHGRIDGLTYHLIDHEHKDEWKQRNKMPTFPQIFYKKNINRIRLGGLTDLEDYLARHQMV